MPQLKPGDLFVAICDWNGVLQWLSTDGIRGKVGQPGWAYLCPEDAERVKTAVSRTVTLNERHVLEACADNGNRYRIWLWPIGTPELAVCSFNLLIPSEVGKLTVKEREFMRLLGAGEGIKGIATKMDVSINTAHTHMRRVREKLGLKSTHEAVAFAARFFAPLRNTDIRSPSVDAWSEAAVPAAAESRKKIKPVKRVRTAQR